MARPAGAPYPRGLTPLADWVLNLGFDTFVFWPTDTPIDQTRRFAADVVPRLRELVAAGGARPGRQQLSSHSTTDKESP